MNKEVNEDSSILIRERYLDKEGKKIANFLKPYAFKDDKQVYTNGVILVPLFRVLDALRQHGDKYCEG